MPAPVYGALLDPAAGDDGERDGDEDGERPFEDLGPL